LLLAVRGDLFYNPVNSMRGLPEQPLLVFRDAGVCAIGVALMLVKD